MASGRSDGRCAKRQASLFLSFLQIIKNLHLLQEILIHSHFLLLKGTHSPPACPNHANHRPTLRFPLPSHFLIISASCSNSHNNHSPPPPPPPFPPFPNSKTPTSVFPPGILPRAIRQKKTHLLRCIPLHDLTPLPSPLQNHTPHIILGTRNQASGFHGSDFPRG